MASFRTAFQDLSVLTTDSVAVSPCSSKPVSCVNCAIGASVPKFQTTAATTFRPSRRRGAMSAVSKRQ